MIHTIHHFGYLGIFLTILLEIGFMIFPLPGDTLLFTTGIIAQGQMLSYPILLLVAISSSVLAGHVGYSIGTRIKRETLTNNRIYKVNPEYIEKTEQFFRDYGVYAILLSRFVPVVRNFISQILGIIKYDKKKFFWANAGASIVWPTIVVTLGYELGKMFPKLISYAEYGMLFVLIVLGFPVIKEVLKTKKSGH